jgi:hypothetical protein
MFGFMYLLKPFIQKYDFEYKLILAIVIGCIYTFLVKFLITYKRPELPKEREEREAIDKKINEMLLEEITLSTNEKIRGIFLDEVEYLEDIENGNRYYKTSILKIEKVNREN